MHISRYFPLLIGLSLALAACEEDLPFDDFPYEEVRSIGAFTELRIEGDVTIFLNSDSIPGVPGDVIMRSDARNPGDNLELRNDGSTLRISARNSGLGRDRLFVFLYTNDLRSVVVEGDSRARLVPDLSLSDLSLKTEGSSDLEVYGLCVDRLQSKREGSSHLYLSSALDTLGVSLAIDTANVVAVEPYGSRFVVWTDVEIFYADNTTINTVGQYVLTGSVIRYCLVGRHEIKNEGDGLIEAFDMPALYTEVKNEGSAEAEVTVWRELDVKGEGNSMLYYRGYPRINDVMEGSARLVDAN